MPNRTTVISCLLVAIGVVVLATWMWTEDTAVAERPKKATDKRKDDGKGPGDEKLPDFPDTPGYLTNLLCNDGWTRAAATEVERHTEEAWEPPTKQWVQRNPTIVRYLRNLGRFPEAMTLLEQRPECALLVAGSRHPGRVAKALGGLKSEEDYRAVEGWFKRYPAEDDANLLLEALETRGTLLLDLWNKQVYGAEVLFMFPRNTDAGRAYDRWLTELIQRAILPHKQLSGEQAALIAYLVCQGADIRERMAAAPDFAHKFADTLWPRFEKLAGPDLWDAYAAMPGLWQVLERDDGVELVTKFYQLPVLLLASPERYEEKYHEFIIQAFKKDPEDLTLLMVLELNRKEVEFKKLLERPLTAVALREIVREQANLSGDMPEGEAAAKARQDRLVYVRDLSNAAVEAQYGGRSDPWLVTLIPGYDVYALVDKLLDGRDVAAEDVVAAVVDGVSLIPGAKVATKTADAANQQALRLATRSGRKIEQKVLQQTQTRFAQKVTQKTVSKTTRGALLSNTLKVAVQTPLRDLVKLAQGVDLTGLFRLVTDQSGIGLRSVRHLLPWGTKFLVHEGGRVFVSVSESKAREWGGRLVESVAQDAVRKLIGTGAKSADLDRAWRRNTYAWWAVHQLSRP